MKRSSFWFLFLFICFLAGFLHGILPGMKDSIKVHVDNSSLTKQNIEFLLGPYLKQENLNLEFVDQQFSDIIITNQNLKLNKLDTPFLDIIKNKIHPDFLTNEFQSGIPLFWLVKENFLHIEYLFIHKTTHVARLKNLLEFLTEWKHQLPFLLSGPYASTLKEEPHTQLAKEKKAVNLRSFDLQSLKLKPF